jgi:hypothetical protein
LILTAETKPDFDGKKALFSRLERLILAVAMRHSHDENKAFLWQRWGFFSGFVALSTINFATF